MVRKSRKHPHIDLLIKTMPRYCGLYLAVVQDKDSSGSIENQRLIIEEWGCQNRTSIMHYYIDNGFSGKRFDRLAFQQMILDILEDKIECIVVKDLSQLCFPVMP